jgi:hypothetical protein
MKQSQEGATKDAQRSIVRHHEIMSNDIRERVTTNAPPIKRRRTHAPFSPKSNEVEVKRLRRKVAEIEARLELLEAAFGGGFDIP